MATEDIDIFDEGSADQGMYRADGAKKSARGFLGPIKNLVTGGTMTEFSTDMEVDGRRIQIPTMVPTLSQEEIQYMQMMEPGKGCLLYTSPSPRDRTRSRMPSSA